MNSSVTKHSIVIGSHKISISLASERRLHQNSLARSMRNVSSGRKSLARTRAGYWADSAGRGRRSCRCQQLSERPPAPLGRWDFFVSVARLARRVCMAPPGFF
jgi:hypothetical protein